mgnify:CR=1 FL=1
MVAMPMNAMLRVAARLGIVSNPVCSLHSGCIRCRVGGLNSKGCFTATRRSLGERVKPRRTVAAYSGGF